MECGVTPRWAAVIGSECTLPCCGHWWPGEAEVRTRIGAGARPKSHSDADGALPQPVCYQPPGQPAPHPTPKAGQKLKIVVKVLITERHWGSTPGLIRPAERRT
jgi:hypothetical protein